MKGRTSICALLVTLSMGMTAHGDTERKEFQALQLLPPGSVLTNVSLPRYSEDKLSMLVTAPSMKVESETEFSGKDVMTYLLDKSRRVTSKIYMLDASYFFNRSVLVSKSMTIMKDYRLEAESSGLTFDTEKKVGFMHGPGTLVIHNMKKK